MKKRRMVYIWLLLGIGMFIAGFASGVLRAEAEQQKQEREQLREEVQEKIKKNIEKMGMQMLTGRSGRRRPRMIKYRLFGGSAMW